MGFTAIINQAASMLWYLIPISIFTTVIKTPWFKGDAKMRVPYPKHYKPWEI